MGNIIRYVHTSAVANYIACRTGTYAGVARSSYRANSSAVTAMGNIITQIHTSAVTIDIACRAGTYA